MSKFSILHISDLRKMEGTTYEALLQSLLTDRDAYYILSTRKEMEIFDALSYSYSSAKQKSHTDY